MKKKVKSKKTVRRTTSNTKLLFLSLILLFIVFEALYIVKGQISPQAPQVAGVSTQK